MSLYQRVAYITPNGANEILPKSTGGGSLGSDLFTSANEFIYNTYAGDGIYPLDNQGLIALMASDSTPPWGTPYADGGYRIVTKPDGTMDVIPLMEALASICAYGTNDEGASFANLKTAAKSAPVEMRCGDTIEFSMNCANQVGVQTRQVHFLNVTNPNYFDDGHIALEASTADGWKLFDIPNDLAWELGGEMLSCADVISNGVDNCDKVKLAEHRVGGTDTVAWVSAFYEMILRNDAMMADWHKRIFEVPGMAVSGGIVWGLPDSLSSYKSYIENYPGANGWSVISLDDWIAQYY